MTALVKTSNSLRAAIENDKKAQMVKPARGEALVICLDCSGSMKGATPGAPSRLHAAIEAARNLMGASGPTSKIGAVAFSDYVHEQIGIATPRYLAREKLSSFLKHDGGTVFCRALDAAHTMLVPTERSELRRIVLLSDGEDYPEHRAELLAVLDKLSMGGVIVDTVAFGTEAGRELLQEISKKTGGTFKEAKDAASLTKQFLALEARVRGLLK